MQPLLKWAGGKRWLAPTIATMYQPYQEQGYRFVEPFAGGLAAAWHIEPTRCLANDLNRELINLYQQLIINRKNLEDGIAGIGVEINEVTYYNLRYEYTRNAIVDSVLSYKAALFYVLNKTCYHGLWRVNSSGEFNVPYGFYKNPRIETDLTAWQQIARNWEFTAGSYDHIRVLSKDFLYVDPPHDNGFSNYTTEGFNIWDQQELAEWLAKLNNPIVVSNAATESMINMYKRAGFRTFTVTAPRGFGKAKPELIAMKGLDK